MLGGKIMREISNEKFLLHNAIQSCWYFVIDNQFKISEKYHKTYEVVARVHKNCEKYLNITTFILLKYKSP